MLDGMTNIKAREVLKELKDYTEDLPHYSPDEVAESIEMAIKALEAQPSEDCISRQAVIEQAMDYGSKTFLIPVNSIKALPPVTPERPKGEWDFIGYQMFECSSCRNVYTQNQFEAIKLYTTDDLLPKYCPNCGSYNGGGEDAT